MKERRDSLSYRKNILENLIDKPPFRYEKCTSSDGSNIDIKESENVVNISFTRNRRDVPSVRFNNSQISDDRCHTTINLFINDPHSIQRNCGDSSLPQNRKFGRNDIVLGKNIPNHSLMENLLNDLGVKKFSSAPNMTPTYNNEFTRYSRRTPTRISPGTTTRRNEVEAENNEMSFLYVNDKSCCGDFENMNTEKIMEKHNEKVSTEDETKHSVQHRDDNYIFNVTNGRTISDLENRDNPNTSPGKLIENLKNKEKASILYEDTTGVKLTEVEEPVQPRKTFPNFRIRTQMVRNVLNTDPEFMNNYYSKLMRNHKKMIETMRTINFQEHTMDKERTTFKTDGIISKTKMDSVPNVPLKRDQNEVERCHNISGLELPSIKEIGKIDKIEKASHLLNGKIPRSVCSIESHGSYDEYKKNLVIKSDGTLCCKNTKDLDDDVWSRAETRNIITSEFIKDKIRRFEKFTRNKVLKQEHLPESNEAKTNEVMNKSINNQEKSPKLLENTEQESNPMILDGNLQSVSFPKETKNAMMRLLAENLNNNLKYKRLKSRARKWDNQLAERANVGQVPKLRSELVETHVQNKRFWPGMAERVLARPEENIP